MRNTVQSRKENGLAGFYCSPFKLVYQKRIFCIFIMTLFNPFSSHLVTSSYPVFTKDCTRKMDDAAPVPPAAQK